LTKYAENERFYNVTSPTFICCCFFSHDEIDADVERWERRGVKTIKKQSLFLLVNHFATGENVVKIKLQERNYITTYVTRKEDV